MPFDGNLKECTNYVVNSDSRPMIDVDGENRTVSRIAEEADAEAEADLDEKVVVSEPLADLIRNCWQTDPRDRLKMGVVCEKLAKELQTELDEKFSEESLLMIEKPEQNDGIINISDQQNENERERFQTAVEPE